MARTETTTRTLFKFEELNDSAKSNALDKHRQFISEDWNGVDSMRDDLEIIASIYGIDFRTYAVQLHGGGTRQDPCIWYQGFSSQGDGASFEGTYEYAKDAPKAIRDHAPVDKELHRIADELQKAQRPFFYRLKANITRGHGSNFYSHSGTMAVEVYDERDQYRDIGEAAETITQLLKDFADWMYKSFREEYEYQTGDEAVTESIEANEYEFDENGELA